MFKQHKSNTKDIVTEALIIPVFKGSKTFLYHETLSDSKVRLKSLFDSGEFTGKEGEISLIHFPEMPFNRIILTGLGDHSNYLCNSLNPSGQEIQFNSAAQEKLRRSGGKTLKFALEKGFQRICISADSFKDMDCFRYPPLFYFLEGGLLNTYNFRTFKTDPEVQKEFKEITLLDKKAEEYLAMLSTIIRSSTLARDLINSPSNHVTPTFLYESAKKIRTRHLKVHCLSEKELSKEGLKGVLAVARGSNEPPRFIILEYRKNKGAPIVVIGKSVTFDSGGISIKPAEGMEKMKYDMAGGAVVIALMRAISDLGLDCNVIGLLPALENLPDGKAYKPGDVITMMNGKSVEIVSTDAEGRMTLADALTYSIKNFKPSAIIDIATLTGACAITFGNEFIGMMGNNQELMDKIIQSGNETYERAWQMPLCDEYGEYIKGETADIKNSGGRNGSMLTAGYFLKEFAGDTPWTHLDIASTAWIEKDKPYLPKGASASGLRLLIDFLKNNG